MAHDAGASFVLIDDAALLPFPDELAHMAASGGAVLQWAPRAGIELTEMPIIVAGRAVRPLAPVHGRIEAGGAGGVAIGWTRRSRADAGWRDHVDLPLGETREAWRVELSPAVAGVGSWECTAPTLTIDAETMATLPPGCAVLIRQIGDFALSAPLALSLT